MNPPPITLVEIVPAAPVVVVNVDGDAIGRYRVKLFGLNRGIVSKDSADAIDLNDAEEDDVIAAAWEFWRQEEAKWFSDKSLDEVEERIEKWGTW